MSEPERPWTHSPWVAAGAVLGPILLAVTAGVDGRSQWAIAWAVLALFNLRTAVRRHVLPRL